MDPRLLKLLGAVTIVLSLLTWGFYERSGKLSAKNQVVELQGSLKVTKKDLATSQRAVQNLRVATTAAETRAAVLEARRRTEDEKLGRQITSLEQVVNDVKNALGKDCRDAFREWRNG